MYMTFKAFMMKEWTLSDNYITVGNKEIKLSSIIKAQHTPISPGNANGVIQVFYGSGAFDFATLAYPQKQKADGEKAAQYILATIRGEDANAKVKAYEKLQKDGFRKRCNVCGHIFCYTFEDLEENQRLAKSAMGSSVSALTGTLAGYRASSSTALQTAEDKLSRIVDYSKCPKCGSKDLADATDADIERSKVPQGTIVQQTSSADELKKFKELLDMGIITQDEFDAKKKQLLGLDNAMPTGGASSTPVISSTHIINESNYTPHKNTAPPSSDSFSTRTVPQGSWLCTCGKVNASYVSSCSCGTNKRDIR